MSNLKGYHVKHKRDIEDYLVKAKEVADYAVKHKNQKIYIYKNGKTYRFAQYY